VRAADAAAPTASASDATPPPPRRPAAEPIEDEGPVPFDLGPADGPETADVREGRTPTGPARERRPRADGASRGVPDGAEGERVPIDERLRRAEQRLDAVAARVGRLRARANAAVVQDVEEYQRVQADLEAALEQQDRLEAQVARLRRQAGRPY
jgi:hypothetical protein